MLLVVLASAIRAEVAFPIPTEMGSGITIRVSSPVSSVPHFGFLPIRVSVENLTTRDGTWSFRFIAGMPGTFPGTSTSVFELSAPASQTRESWFHVPLAGPGVTVNAVALTAGSAVSAAQLPTAPPRIPGVYPNPRISGVNYDEKRTLSSGTSGLTRTFTITQTGPARLLPPISQSRLPAGATTSLTTNPDGTVIRTTSIPVVVNTGASTGAAAINPSTIALTNARQELTKAGFLTSASRTSSSVQVRAGAKPGTQEVTVFVKETGPAASLTLPDVATLPAGFTAVNVTPDPGNSASAIREFTYVENVPLAGPSIAAGIALPPARSLSAVDAQNEARKILAPTGLLDLDPQVKHSASTQYVSVSATAASGVVPMSPYHVIVFEQTGPAPLLPQLVATDLPPGVRLTVFPNPGGDVTRIVSVVDPALVTALFNAAGSATGPGMIASHAINAARVELQRFGFLRALPGVTVAPPMTRSSGTPGTPSPDLIIFSESGPATLLLPPPQHLLATGITFNVTPGALPGEVVRNFIVNIPGFIAGGGGLTVSPAGAGVGRRSVPRVSGMTAVASMLIVEASGPGLAGQVRANLPNTANASTMGPLATTPALEQVVRGKFSSSGTRSLPHIAGFEFTSVPPDWRVWSSFNSALLTTDDYGALDGARRAALRTWIAGGGILFLTPSTPGTARTERLGAGRIETLAEPLEEVEPADIFGRLQLGRFSPGMPDRDRVSFAPGTPIEQVIKFQPLDALWLSIFLIVFAAVIGPVNLFWFARTTKRYRLFFTTPLISLTGAAAVAAAIVLEDGLGGAGIRRTLVWLVPGENQAAIFQEQGARTGFLTRRNFPLEDRVLCAALPVDGNVHTFDRVMRVFNREAGRAGGDWFGNRSRQAQLLRGVAPTRARIEFTGTAANGAPIIQSTLTTELRDLRLRDAEGRTWGAAVVPMGRPVTLSAGVTDPFAPAESNLNGTSNLNDLMKDAATLTEPLQWVAAGSATEFAPIPTLQSIRWSDDPIVYAGFAERSGTPSRAAGRGSE